MKIRTQLLLACFVLSVVPLTGVVFYSYRSSRLALENAYHKEASRLTAQMDRRLTAIGNDLDQRLTQLASMPMPDKSQQPIVDNAMTTMSEVAPFVDTLEFEPVTPPTPPKVSVSVAAAPPAAPKITQAPDGSSAPAIPEPPAPAAPEAPIVIKINPLPDDFQERIRDIADLSAEVSKADDPDERAQLQKQLNEKKADLKKDVDEHRKVFRDQVSAIQQQKRTLRDVTRAKAQVWRVDQLTDEQKQEFTKMQKETSLLFGQKFNVPIHRGGEVVGHLRAQLSTAAVIRRVLGAANDDSGEIPFVVDREGTVYTRDDSERTRLHDLGVLDALEKRQPLPRVPNWVIATTVYQQSGVRIGAARPIGENLDELRRTAARNFGWGVGVIALALIGILPVASHFTRDIHTVTEGARRISQGDLMTRLPVKSNNEFGELATAFNRMAEDLSVQQQQIVQQRVMQMEYDRKSAELEEARRFQLSMLPKEVPKHDRFEIAASTQTATEVGGDYYDFHVSPDGALSVTIGDATGHGAKAGTMVTVVKTLFSDYDSGTEPGDFLTDAAEKIKRMELGRMAMALSLARFDGTRLTVASAGMPPVLIHRALSGMVEEITLGATPLGTLGVDYEQSVTKVSEGDTILMMSDGFPELQRGDGTQLGYPGALDKFAAAAKAATADEVIASLEDAANEWHGNQPPNDDITFVVVRCRA